MADKIEINLAEVEKLAMRGLNLEQISFALGISKRTMIRRKKENEAIEEAYRKGKAKGVGVIANALFDKAKQGNTTAQIFFLKCNGWKEESTLEVKDLTPVKIIIKDDLKE